MKEQNSKNGRHSNALKHGAFATELFIFEEDRSEFEELHNGFIEEFKPAGRMENELVLEIAKLHWRKRRIEKFYVHEADWLCAHPGEEGLENLARIKRNLTKGTPCGAIWEQIKRLPAPMYKAFEASVEYPSKEIDDNWIERVENIAEYIFRQSDIAISNHRKSPRFLGEAAAKLMDLSIKRIAIEERLDAMIDRLLKRLAQLKTYKEVVAAKDAGTPRNISVR